MTDQLRGTIDELDEQLRETELRQSELDDLLKERVTGAPLVAIQLSKLDDPDAADVMLRQLRGEASRLPLLLHRLRVARCESFIELNELERERIRPDLDAARTRETALKETADAAQREYERARNERMGLENLFNSAQSNVIREQSNRQTLQAEYSNIIAASMR
jgi:hypothetical protein